MQKAIPYMHFRGGSSKGLFFDAKDLPTDATMRNQYILAAIEGSDKGDSRQIDGLGGGSSLTSKVAIVSKSTIQTAIPCLDYYFVQVVIGKGQVSTTQTCGNILAAVLPFAIESGMIQAVHPVTKAIINILNTGGQCEVTVQTPNQQITYAGATHIDGVVGTAAPIICNYLDTQGATCGTLFPTENTVDEIEGKKVTCIDNGMPLVLLRAEDFNITGYETKEFLDKEEHLKQQIESIRLEAGRRMKLGNVEYQTIPKMCLIAPPQYGGIIATRMFIPHVCHDAIGVLAAVSVATACILPNTIATAIAILPDKTTTYHIEHPTGAMNVYFKITRYDNNLTIQKSGIVRTARLLSRGEVFIPYV